MKSQAALLLAFAIVLSSAEYISDKPCPTDRPVQQNFDLKRYTAVSWYEIMRYDLTMERGFDCGHAIYTLVDDNSINFNYCHKKLTDNKETCFTGKSFVSFPEHKPIEGRFNASIGSHAHDNSNHWVVSTDYEHYSIVNFCNNIANGKSSEALWIISPHRQLDSSVQPIVDDIIDKYFKREKIIFAEQDIEKCSAH